MSAAVSVIATAADASLAGPPDHGAGPAVVLGDAPAGERPADVRWLDRPSGPEDPPAERLIAPAGDHLWRTAPWPAADPLFELPPATGDRALVTGAEAGLRHTLAERASARGVRLEQVDELDAGHLAGAACVILAEAPGGALPARSFAVLAAGRLLIVPRLQTMFGLEDGLDHVEFADPDEAVTLVEAYRRASDAFARITAWGRVKARPQRASVAYARLAEDLRRDGLTGRT